MSATWRQFQECFGEGYEARCRARFNEGSGVRELRITVTPRPDSTSVDARVTRVLGPVHGHTPVAHLSLNVPGEALAGLDVRAVMSLLSCAPVQDRLRDRGWPHQGLLALDWD